MSGSFDVQTVLKECLDDIRKEFPSLAETLDKEYVEIDFKAEVERFKILLQPIFMQIVKKDDKIFAEPQMFLRGIDFSILMKDATEKQKDTLWTYIRMFLVCSYLGSDIMETVKGLWSKLSGQAATSEVDEILKEEGTQSGIQDLLETLKDTRIFKLGMEVMENLNVESLGLGEIDFSDIGGLLEMVKNPEHPVTKKAVSAVQKLIDQKMRTGSLKKEDFIREIEMLKEKFKHSLGRLFKKEFFGETAGAGAGAGGGDRPTPTAADLMSNHPEARRARMLARLQRKLGKK
jgi:hypothetical protein|uniref:Uncharacterized protein n=1 Tax=viral metagenome TaxID=1070528 RepID=A0A6C0K8Y0_9ZZZZ